MAVFTEKYIVSVYGNTYDKNNKRGAFTLDKTNRYFGYYKSDLMFPREHALDAYCKKNDIIHYLIDPGKPAQNGKVERSHRSDQEMFYDRNDFNSFEELNYKIRLWNMYYNDLAHCGLNGKSPNQVLLLVN